MFHFLSSSLFLILFPFFTFAGRLMLSFKTLKNILRKVQGLVEHDTHFHFCVKVT